MGSLTPDFNLGDIVTLESYRGRHEIIAIYYSTTLSRFMYMIDRQIPSGYAMKDIDSVASLNVYASSIIHDPAVYYDIKNAEHLTLFANPVTLINGLEMKTVQAAEDKILKEIWKDTK